MVLTFRQCYCLTILGGLQRFTTATLLLGGRKVCHELTASPPTHHAKYKNTAREAGVRVALLCTIVLNRTWARALQAKISTSIRRGSSSSTSPFGSMATLASVTGDGSEVVCSLVTLGDDPSIARGDARAHECRSVCAACWWVAASTSGQGKKRNKYF